MVWREEIPMCNVEDMPLLELHSPKQGILMLKNLWKLGVRQKELRIQPPNCKQPNSKGWFQNHGLGLLLKRTIILGSFGLENSFIFPKASMVEYILEHPLLSVLRTYRGHTLKMQAKNSALLVNKETFISRIITYNEIASHRSLWHFSFLPVLSF